MAMLKGYHSVATSLGALTVALALPAHAQTGNTGTNAAATAESIDSSQVADIVVTAQRREQNIQKVPVTISAIGGESLVTRGVSNIEDLGRSVTGVQMSVSAGTILPFVRGVGNTATTIGNESSVAVYVDGLYYSRLPSGVFNLRNVSRVEVLKGPQGTLFGRNASAGVIQVVTLDPSQEFSGSGSLSLGNYKTVEGSFYVTGGLAENLAADLSISGRYQDKGFGKNPIFKYKTNYFNDFSARAKFLFTPSDDTRITLTGFYSYAESTFQQNTAPGTTRGYISAPTLNNPRLGFWDQDNDFFSPSKADVYGGSLKFEQELPFARFTSITGYIKTITNNRSDGDYGPRPDFTTSFGGPVNQFTQEFQLSSLRGSALEWTLGAFYYDTKNAYDDRSIFVSPSGALPFGPTGQIVIGKSHPKSYALYGQATYEILPQLRATGGLRYTWDRQTASGEFRSGATGAVIRTFPDGKDKFEKLTFRAGLDYQLTPTALLYTSVSRGFKSGVFNLLTYNPVPNRPEILTAYEVGFKTDLFDRRLRLNGAAFYYDLSDPQVSLIIGSTTAFSNADAARVKGVEMEAEAVLADGLRARLGATYVSSKYTRYPNAPTGTSCPPAFVLPSGACTPGAPTGGALNGPRFGSISPPRQTNASGNFQPFAPELTINAGIDYEIETSSGKWMLTADAFYNDGYFTEPDNFVHNPSFVIVNAQAKYSPNDHFGFRLWGKNLLKEKYIQRGTLAAGAPGWPISPGAPRTYGVAVDFKF